MNQLIEIIKQGRGVKYHFPPLARLGKLFEEGGEFSETVLHNQGYLPHKTPKESPFGEAADVLICLVDTLASLYPELSPAHIAATLENQVILKREKWQRVVITPGNLKV
jgi:NTP pyrophosphatase (non-canonical NTP hydrolase)